MITAAASCNEVTRSDLVVVGSGVAGLMVALHARGRSITLISKTGFAAGGSSVYAQGGVAAALGADDSPLLHATDTVAAGVGLCDPEVVRIVTEEGPERLAELLRLGARFDREVSGRLSLGREGAHGRRRVVHAAGDATGAELVRALADAVRSKRRVQCVDDALALDLVLTGDRVVGVITVDRTGRVVLHVARAVVLATGGIGQIYRHTTNPVEATGDGLAMAARAGARLAGLEFVQFHPTALAVGGNPMPLLTEALRGEGCVLIDEHGRRFMEEIHPLAELAPRDVVARAIWRLRREGHEAFLDASSMGEHVGLRFPTVMQLCLDRGIDPRTDPMPVAPAAHYHMGGVVVDQVGRTTVEGLWACGEVTHTGLHGANRLASNSLLEALVFGARVGERLAGTDLPIPEVATAQAAMRSAGTGPADRPWLDDSEGGIAHTIRDIMWSCVGLERTASGLQLALWELSQLELQATRGLGELRNLLTVARLVARAAWARTESRGSHFRSDVPWRDPHWQQPLYFEGDRMVDPQPIAAAG